MIDRKWDGRILEPFGSLTHLEEGASQRGRLRKGDGGLLDPNDDALEAPAALPKRDLLDPRLGILVNP